MQLSNEHIRQSNLIEGINSPNEDEQSWKAWEYIISKDKLTNVNIRAMHRLIVKNQADLETNQKGQYRDASKTNVLDVSVGSDKPPDWSFVKQMMDDWIWISEKMEFGPWGMHVRFERIHPFVDGNGRSGRMLMWWQEVKRGMSPTLIAAEKRQLYYKALSGARDVKRSGD